jgi:hypothetical protein
MNWDAIGSLAELLSALGVLITLVYLARQISHANQLGRSSTVTVIEQKYNVLNEMILTSDATAELTAKLADASFVPERGRDTLRADALANYLFNIWIAIQKSYDEGHIDEALFETYCHDVEIQMRRSPALRPYFRQLVERYPVAKTWRIMRPLV